MLVTELVVQVVVPWSECKREWKNPKDSLALCSVLKLLLDVGIPS